MSETLHQLPLCPGCGSPRGEHQPRCWLCGDVSPVVAAKHDSPLPSRNIDRGAATFSLGTLMFAITVVAVCLGVAVRWPLVGVPLIVVIVLGSIRAIFVSAIAPASAARSILAIN